MITSLHVMYNYVGKLLAEELIDRDLVYFMTHDTVLFQWDMWKDIVYEERKRYYDDGWMEYWEYLANEMMKKKQELGYKWRYLFKERHLPETA